MMPCIFKNSRAFWPIYMSKAFAWIRCCTPPEHYDGVAAAWCWRWATKQGSCKFLDFHTPAGGKWMLECWREPLLTKKQLWIHLASSFFSARCGKLLVIVKKTLWWARNEDSVVATLNSQHQLGEFKQSDLLGPSWSWTVFSPEKWPKPNREIVFQIFQAPFLQGRGMLNFRGVLYCPQNGASPQFTARRGGLSFVGNISKCPQCKLGHLYSF